MIFKDKIRDILNNAVEQTFKLTLDLDVKFQDSQTGGLTLGPMDFAGVMKFHSGSIPGVFIMGCDLETVLFLHEKMYPKNKIRVAEKCHGIISELTNIIYGKIKSDMNSVGFDLDMGFPETVSTDSRQYFLNHSGVQIYHFQLETYNIYISVKLENENVLP